MIHSRCMEQCQDINGNIDNSFLKQYHDAVGFGMIIDSLAALRKIIYDVKVISMDELLKALDVNFEGKGEIRSMCLQSPKYGKNDFYVDSRGVEIERIHMDYLKTIRGLHGELLTMRMVPVTNHLSMGKITGASIMSPGDWTRN